MGYNVILTNDGETEGFNMLNEKGIKTFHFPMIKTLPYSQDLEFLLSDFDYFIFTSKNGVKYFFDHKNIKSQDKSSMKSICIGSKTALELKKQKLDSVYTAKRSYSNILFDDLKSIKILESKKVMLVQGNLAKNYLFENLKLICYLTKFVPYKTELIKIVNRNLESLLNKKETYTVFTSPSCFLSFQNLYDVSKTSIISIGETTSSFIKEKGFNPLFTSKMQSYEGISQSIISNLKIS